ncbi:MAG TPA: hypothetical protein VFR09_08285, partial [Alphaproteobacteria bacterium]|nr:hypothetical protein [Alphaproteobacteria bacterium]
MARWDLKAKQPKCYETLRAPIPVEKLDREKTFAVGQHVYIVDHGQEAVIAAPIVSLREIGQAEARYPMVGGDVMYTVMLRPEINGVLEARHFPANYIFNTS